MDSRTNTPTNSVPPDTDFINSKPALQNAKNGTANNNFVQAPAISLPKGGGAIKGIDEKFSVNAANGTASFNIPLPFSPGRNAFMPAIELNYNSGSGNGIFGMGWNAEPAAITRRTDKKLPRYFDEEHADTFVFSGAEDLVPALVKDESGNWIADERITGGTKYMRYKPRIESGFARIEKITEKDGNVFWRATTKENVVSVYGKSALAQLSDPSDQTKIFKWLLEFCYDDKGNCYLLQYKKEDKVNIANLLYEKNRLNDLSACTNIYLKRVKYCNAKHFNRALIDFNNWDALINNIDFLLELVFDFGEHDTTNPQPQDDNGWICRQDPFSRYSAGFEIRTWRLCQRILMFHHFSELGDAACLVRSTDIIYNTGTSFTFLSAVTQKGFIRNQTASADPYTQKGLPAVEFTYEPLGWDTSVKSLPAQSLENLPAGIDDKMYQWIDLYSEGVAGVLTEQANGWYYKANAGDGVFDRAKLISPKPSVTGLAAGTVHIQDIEANGEKQAVSSSLNGYYELSAEGEWQPFKYFQCNPNIELWGANAKLFDLTGDGKADIIISEEQVFRWFESKGKQGYASYQLSGKTMDEEKGPAIVFADSTQSIVIADMSGDGLMDIVRIRNGEIVYWPNLGYAKFGARVSMGNAPVFDTPDHFNPQYLKLADLDGSGTTDIVYLGDGSIKIYFNQGGNSWSDTNIVNGINAVPFFRTDDQSSVNIVDLLGNGTTCIVWSTPLTNYAANPIRYIDLMGGKKPHIMTGYKNNMGKEVNFSYKPSTFFYLQDKRLGNDWVTKLPFPVQCVSEVETTDQIRKARFTNGYSYHHGYYDHYEREFRGFGRVDQTDTEVYENYKKNANGDGGFQLVDEGFYEPPVLTKTWFHTGAFIDKEKILNQFMHEYYQNALVPEKILAEPSLPGTLSIDEWREALRACKGLPLHVEVYSIDGSDAQNNPYSTAHHTCLIQLLQPKADNQYAVFMVQESEALTYAYERNPADPRIDHKMNIETDQFGNVLKAAVISYGRKTADASLAANEQAEQNKTHIVLSEHNVTNSVDNETDYRLPVGYETKTNELTGLAPETDGYFSVTGILSDFENAVEIAYEQTAAGGLKQKRVIEHVKTLFLSNNLAGPLSEGIMESLALPYQVYKLALTPGLVNFIFGDRADDDLLRNTAKYAALNDSNYWIASGTQRFDAANFYQVTEITDAFGFSSQMQYDGTYHFYLQNTTDALGNAAEVLLFNFRTISPYLMKDVNNNTVAVRLDELGMVTSTFVMGKTGENKGDSFDSSSAETSSADHPGSLLQYNLSDYYSSGKPCAVKTTVNETHFFDSGTTGATTASQTTYVYYSGSGTEVMRKIQAEPGLALQENEDGSVTQIDTGTAVRWVGNGRTVVNNKGKPVKQYEPYFSADFDYEDEKQLVERGVTPLIYYDSAGRVIKTAFPDGSVARVEYDAWMQKSFDQNDTVLDIDCAWYDQRVTHPLSDAEWQLQKKDGAKEKEAAQKAALHADTPAVFYFDALGRIFLTVADNANAGKYKTFAQTDIEGNLVGVTDARGNAVVQYKYDMLGNQLYSLSMDTGERWMINDVLGKPIKAVDSRGHVFRYEYDNLHRPLKSFVATNDVAEINFTKIIYGEDIANDKTFNLRGKPWQQLDGAGIVTNIAYDFKGNALQNSRQLCADYKNDIDWNTNPQMETAIFNSSTSFDALNRPVMITSPDNSIVTPSYNEAALLEKIEIQLKGLAEKSVFVKDINYNEKRQRESIIYGNDTKTSYSYDAKTFRLVQLITNRKNEADPVQKLSYTYDAVGNLSFIKDEAQQTFFYNNTVIDPSCNYVYDAIYQLVQANGREHIGQNQLPQDNFKDEFFTSLVQKGDGNAMRNYTQSFLYDEAGNILQLQHSANGGSYTRAYEYETTGNQLKNTKINDLVFSYQYDTHGNIDQVPHLSIMEWNFLDRLQVTQQTQSGNSTGEKTYYVYDASGQRIRKITEWQGSSAKKEERIYLGAFEIFRSYKADGTTIALERETLHVMDDKDKIALVETKTKDNASGDSTALDIPLTRYQLSNHLGSACLELDENATIISYEEYHPYGTTSYQAMDKNINPVAKRYRYTGMERDEESGFAYHSARYYLPWLARWLNADPIGIKGGMNLYAYGNNNPITFSDLNGLDPGNLPLPDISYQFKGSKGTDTRVQTPDLKLQDDNYEDKYGDRLPVNTVGFHHGKVNIGGGHLNLSGDISYDNGDPMSDPTTIHLKLQADYPDWRNLRLHTSADASIGGDWFTFANVHADANISIPPGDIITSLLNGNFDRSHLDQFLKNHPLKIRAHVDLLSLDKVPGFSYVWDAIRPRVVYNAWLDTHGNFNSDLHLYPFNVLPAGMLAPTPYPALGYEYIGQRGDDEFTAGVAASSKIDITDLSTPARSYASLYGSLKDKTNELSISGGYYSPPVQTYTQGIPDALRNAGAPDTQGLLETTSGWSIKLMWKHKI